MQPAFRTACLVCAGIALGWSGLPHGALAACVAAAVALVARQAWRGHGVAMLLVCAAWVRWIAVASVEPPAVPAGAHAELVGVVLERVEREARTDLRVRGWLREDGAATSEPTTVVARCRDGVDVGVRYGSTVSIVGDFEAPSGRRNPGGFDYGQYLRRRDVHGILRVAPGAVTVTGVGGWAVLRALDHVRARVLRVLDAGLDEPYDALAAGILIGERRAIPNDILDAFRDGGVIHVLVVSGANFALLVAATYVLLAALRMPLRVVYIGTMLLAIAFAALIGPQPPVLRALLVCLLYLTAKLMERSTSAMNALAVSAVVLLLWNPYSLFDAGFQLSYAATAGLLYFTPRWLETLKPIGDRVCRTWPGRLAWTWLVGAGVVTAAVQISTVPVTLYHFQRVSIAGFLANLPVGIIVALAMVCAMVTVGVGFVSIAASAIPANALWLLLRCLNPIVGFFASAEHAVLFVPRASAPFLGAYLFLTLTLTHYRDVRRRTAQWGVVALAAAACSVWGVALVTPGGLLTLTFLDVGQGDSAVVECPDGTTVVVDGGNRRQGVDYGESVVVPHLLHAADMDIENVVMTHADMDHSGGLPYVLRRIGAARVVGVAEDASQGAVAAVRVAAEDTDALVRHGAGLTLHAGTTRGQPLSVEVVYPRSPGDVDILDDDANADSLVLLVRYGAFRALLAADIEAGVEAFLAQADDEGWADISAHVLKAPHHGSDTSSTPRFLAAVRPELAVISAGARNRHGHPSAATLARYEAAGIRVLRTDHDGAVTISTDGRRCWVRTAAR